MLSFGFSPNLFPCSMLMVTELVWRKAVWGGTRNKQQAGTKWE